MRKNTVLFWKDIFSDHRHESRRLFGDLVGMGNFFIRRLHFGIIIAINRRKHFTVTYRIPVLFLQNNTNV